MLKFNDMEKKLHSILQGSLEVKSMKLGLDRMRHFDQILGYPSKQIACVLIAGTNGKGSVTTKIARCLEATGKKVGLYTSPHLETFHERIQINRIPIPEEKADRLLRKIFRATEDEAPSYFELLTLLAFCYFSEEKVDFAVLEAGMGGRLDATNIVTPLLSVITSIDLDHIQYLGNSLEEIAYEKAGIIKAGIPILLGPHAKPVEVFEEAAGRVQSPLFQVQGNFSNYEEENQAIAYKALSLLPFPLEKNSLAIGLAAVPPCRFEIVGNDPLVILDVAHNPDGLRRTFERLYHAYPEKKVRVLAGFSEDKNIDGALKVIGQHAAGIHLTHTNHARLAPLGDPDFEKAFESAYSVAKAQQEILLVCGTFFIMQRARAAAKSMLAQMDGQPSRSSENSI
jgi:dihydrofolate synthase / folylpolyglutamate synthase